MANKTHYMTPRARLSFAQQLFQPKSFNGGKAKYGCSLLFDAAARETDAFKALQAAAEQAKADKWGSKAATMRTRTPFLDGDEFSHYGGYAGMVFLRVSTEFKPGFVDRARNEIPFDLAEDEIYSGCFVRATLNVFAYETQGNRGVSFGLRNIQKLGDGEKLFSRDAASDFGSVDDDGEDLDGKFERDLVG